MTTWNRDDSDLTTVLGLNSTTVGNIRITGNTIGHSSDTDILTFAETTLDITSPNVDINGNLTIKNTAGNTTYVTLSNSGILVNGSITATGTITGVLSTASQPNITTVGTIGTGIWQGTAIANSYIADLPTSKITSGTFDDARISQSSVTQHQASLSIATTQLTGNMPDARIIASNITQHQSSITSLGTLTSLNITGAVNVGVDDTGHDVKFFGATSGKYMLWDESENRLIVKGLTDLDGNVEVTGSDFKVNGSVLNTYMLYNNSSNRLELADTTSSANLYLQTISGVGPNAPNIDFYKKSDSSAANDVIGVLDFRGRNNANDADVRFAKIEVDVIDSTKGAEEGRLNLGVTANGSLVQEGIVIKGTGSGIVDVDIANGSGSTTTVAGNLTAGSFTTTGSWTFDEHTSGTIDIDTIQDSGTSFANNDTSLLTAAAIEDKIESYSYTTTTGTITSVEVTTDSGSGARFNQNSGAASFSILGTSGVDVTNSSGTVTVTSVPSEIDHNSLDNYTSTEHFTQANIVTVGTIATGVWEGTAIADAYISSASTWNAKQPQLTFGLSSGNTLRTEEAIAENDILLGGSAHVKGRTYAELKSDLSLNNVENTALSTFAGTSNITTLGTITTGTWNGTAINQTYLEGQSGTNTGDQTKASFDLDHLFTLVGAASDDAEHLSTFTGSTIADNQTIKQALQALETAVESAGGASSLNGLSDVTFSSNDLTIPGLDKIIFDGAVDYDLSGNVTFTENGASFSFLTLDYDSETLELKGNSGNTTLSAQIFTTSSTGRLRCDDVLRLESGTVDVSNPNIEFGSAGGVFGWGMVSGTFTSYIEYNITSNTYKYMNSSDRDDYYQMTVGSHGATTLATVCDSGDNAANLTLDVDGDIELNADGGNITFKDASTSLAEISGSGILSKSVIYFDAETANTIGNGATGAIDWTANQKQKVTITGTSITCNFTNPPGPCNLTLKVVQGDGSDQIGTWDSDIKWAGGSPPTLSTANGAIDILSFYFDGTNYFGVASTNFS